jgi:hypothetical protein
VSGIAVAERWSPIWADYVWLARGENSRLYPVIRQFLQAIEAAAASVTADMLNEFGRRHRLTLAKYKLKCFLYSLCLWRAQQDKYKSRIASELRAQRDASATIGVGLLSRGPLSQIMERYGTDKGSGRHNYTLFYDVLLRNGRERFTRVFELGIGESKFPTTANAGTVGLAGPSLRGWRDYFARASVFGADIEAERLFEDERIKTAVMDQTKADSVERVFRLFGDGFDLIVDDGCHELEGTRTFFECAFRRLKEGGIFIIEDVNCRHRDACKAFLSRYDTAILDLPHPNNRDDNCIAIVMKD